MDEIRQIAKKNAYHIAKCQTGWKDSNIFKLKPDWLQKNAKQRFFSANATKKSQKYAHTLAFMLNSIQRFCSETTLFSGILHKNTNQAILRRTAH